MASREDVYRKFGPKAIEALIRLLRKHVPQFQAFTEQQIINALNDEIDAIPDYDWMNQQTELE